MRPGTDGLSGRLGICVPVGRTSQVRPTLSPAGPERPRLLYVCSRDLDVTPHAGRRRAAHRTPVERRLQGFVRHLDEVSDPWLIPNRAGLPRAIAGRRRGSVPRADFLADVAAVDVRS